MKLGRVEVPGGHGPFSCLDLAKQFPIVSGEIPKLQWHGWPRTWGVATITLVLEVRLGPAWQWLTQVRNWCDCLDLGRMCRPKQCCVMHFIWLCKSWHMPQGQACVMQLFSQVLSAERSVHVWFNAKWCEMFVSTQVVKSSCQTKVLIKFVTSQDWSPGKYWQIVALTEWPWGPVQI